MAKDLRANVSRNGPLSPSFPHAAGMAAAPRTADRINRGNHHTTNTSRHRPTIHTMRSLTVGSDAPSATFGQQREHIALSAGPQLGKRRGIHHAAAEHHAKPDENPAARRPLRRGRRVGPHGPAGLPSSRNRRPAPGVLQPRPEQRRQRETGSQRGGGQRHEHHALEHIGHRDPAGNAGPQDQAERARRPARARARPCPSRTSACGARRSQGEAAQRREARNPRPQERIEAVVADLQVDGAGRRIGVVIHGLAQLAQRLGEAAQGLLEPHGAVGRVAVAVDLGRRRERIADLLEFLERVAGQRLGGRNSTACRLIHGRARSSSPSPWRPTPR